MPTYPNSMSYLLANHLVEAREVGWINTALNGASLTSLIPIVPTNEFMKTSFFERDRASTKNTTKRKINEGVTAKSRNLYTKKEETTQIYNQPISIDKKLLNYDGQLYAREYDNMLTNAAEEIFQDVDYDIVNGTPDAQGYGMVGFEQRVNIGDAMDVNNGTALTLDGSVANFQTFLTLFRRAHDRLKYGAGSTVVAICNEKVEQAISRGRDLLGANVVGTGTVDILNQRVYTIDNVPLLKVRYDSIGTDILPFDENGESSTSIWMMVIGPALEGSTLPNGVNIISSSGAVLDRMVGEETTQITTNIEGDFGLRTPKRSLARFSRILVS